jgi:hypothetical protein
MGLSVNFREVLPPAVIGGVMGGILFVLLVSFVSTTVMQAQQLSLYTGEQLQSPSFVSVLSMLLVGLSVGGFLAAYLASKDRKNRLTHSVLAGLLSGFVSALVILSVTAVMSPQYFDFETETGQFFAILEFGMSVFEVGIMMGIFGIAGAFALLFLTETRFSNHVILSLLIGILFAFGLPAFGIPLLLAVVFLIVLTHTKSDMAKLFTKSAMELKEKPETILPVIVFSTVAFAVIYLIGGLIPGDLTDPNIILGVGFLMMLVTLLLFSMVYAAAISTIASKKRKSFRGIFMDGVYESREIFLGILLVSVPVILLVGILMMGLPYLSQETIQGLLTPLTAGVLLLMNLALFAYVVMVSFIPQVAIVDGESDPRKIVAKSIKFGREKFWVIVVLYVISLGALAMANLLLIALIYLVTLIVKLTPEAMQTLGISLGALLSAILFTYIVTAQTKFYIGVAEK